MPWKPVAVIAVVVLVGGAFLMGLIPERRLRSAAEQESQDLQERLTAAEARVRFSRLLGDVLALKEVTMRRCEPAALRRVPAGRVPADYRAGWRSRLRCPHEAQLLYTRREA
jgi:hypothetical protein